MISISISCEESEIGRVVTMLSGFIGGNQGGVITIPVDCQPVEDGKVEPVFSPLGDLKIADFPPGNVLENPPIKVPHRSDTEIPPKSICDLKEDQIARIKELHEAGKTLDEIKSITGLYDGRIINGVIRRGKPRRLDRRGSSIEDKAIELRNQGVGRSEAARALGVDPKSLKPVYAAESKKDDAVEQAQVLRDIKPLNLSDDIIKRVLAAELAAAVLGGKA